MSEENKKTLEVYEEKASVYLKTTIEHENLDPAKAKRKKEKLEKFINSNIGTLPKGSKVFEIGSGDGINAKYIEEIGYDVTASDVAEAFINETKSKVPNTIKFNVIEDEFTEKYSAFFAWRVFVHFNKEDMAKVLQKTYNALEKDGLFVFNVMNREIKNVDEEWVDFPNEYHMGAERYYKYFKEEEINEIISNTGYKISDFHKEGGDNSNKWLVYVLKK
jgi:2-polyprenyl-3-methyl-5-hydroxy-6-metoxy-1,4-benzoquinol methylase